MSRRPGTSWTAWASPSSLKLQEVHVAAASSAGALQATGGELVSEGTANSATFR